MTDAPAYMNDVLEVLYDDFWISPEVIIVSISTHLFKTQ